MHFLRLCMPMMHLVEVLLRAMIHFVFTLIGQPGLTRVVQRVVAVVDGDVQELGDSTDKLIGGTMTALKYLHVSFLVYNPLVAMSNMQAFRSGATCSLCCLLFANVYCGRNPVASHSAIYPKIQARIRDDFGVDSYLLECLTLLIAGVDLYPLLVERVVSGASVLVKKFWVPPHVWDTGHFAVGGIFDKVLNIQKVASSKKTGHRKCRPQVYRKRSETH